MKRKISVLLVIFLVILLGVVVGKILIKKRRQALMSYPTPKQHPIPAEYAVARKGELRERFKYLGEVLPYSYAFISTKVPGTIQRVFKKEGEKFKKGELLVKIDDSELLHNLRAIEKEREAKASLIKALEAQLEAAKVAQRNAKKEYERDLFLYKKGAIPKEALEKSENLYASAKAKVRTLEAKILELKSGISALEEKKKAILAKLKYTNIRALKDGVVARVFLYPGDLALPGKPIMSVYYPSDGFRVLVNIPPEEGKEIKEGSEAIVEGRYKATVNKIYPASNPKNGLWIAELKLKEEGDLKPKQIVEVEILGKPYQGIILPVNSILHLKGKDIVLKFEGEKLVSVPVRVVKRVNNKVVVEGDLKEGDKVAVGMENKLLELYRRGRAVPAEVVSYE